MPVNTIQIQKLLGKHTFQQLRITVNELIDVVNGLPSTVRGDITRQGGVIDGQATGVIPVHDPGNLLITGSGSLGIGNFLGTDDPNLTGQLHINSPSDDARLNLSQNTATGITYISLQASNTASDPQANNFGFLAATSNTTSQYGMVVLSTANTDQEVSHIFARESWAWGNLADLDSSTRFTLTSGENVGLAPHGGPTAHLAAQLRVDRAISQDPQTTNTAPIISGRGYSSSFGGLGNNQTPVRFVLGDRQTDFTEVANTYATIDFVPVGGETTTTDSIGARIGAEISREDDSTLSRSVSSSLEFSVRSGTGTLQKAMKIIPGGSITGIDSKSAVMVSNTYYLNAVTQRNAAIDGGRLYADAEFGQLIVQQTAEGAFARQGLLVRGNDDAGSGTTTGMARLAMENPVAGYAAGRKWDVRIEDIPGDTPSSKFEINTYPDNDWTATPNTQFSIQVSDATTTFNFGTQSALRTEGPTNGTRLNLSGGNAAAGGEGAEIVMKSNHRVHSLDTGLYPTAWIIDNNGSASFRIFPKNDDNFADTGAATNNDSAVTFRKNTTANTMIGLGTPPSHSLHIQRNWESANVVVESAFGSTTPRNASTAEITVRDSQEIDGRAVILKAVNPDNTYSGGYNAPVSIYAAQQDTDASAEIMRLIHQGTDANLGLGVSTNISFRSSNLSGGAGGGSTAYSTTELRSIVGIGTGTTTSSSGQAPFGVPFADRSDYGSFQIWNAKNRVSNKNFHLTSYGNLGLGYGNNNTSLDPIGLTYPSYNLDLTGRTPAGTDPIETGNTYVAFTVANNTSEEASWLIGVDAGGSVKDFSGIGQTDDPFVIRSVSQRSLNNPRGLRVGATTDERDGLLSIQRLQGESATQIYQIGVREEYNTMTIYTAANTTSPNWSGGAAGRVGIGNTVPAHTLTVNGYNADSSGIAVYGAQAGLRFIDPEPSHPSYLWAGADAGAIRDPGADGVAGTDFPSERTYHIGSRNGSLVVAQQLGPNDTDIHDSAKAATLSVHANTGVSSVTTHAGTRADQRINFVPGLGEDHLQNGSVGINANNVPLASGLFVGDYSKASENRRSTFEEQAFYPSSDAFRFLALEGSYPTLTVLSGRPLSQANGAFKVVSVTAALTSNNSDASGTFEAGTGEIIKRIEGVRRFSEGYIDGAGTPNPTTSRADANTVAWFDGIGVDDKFSIPAPAIGSEFLGTEASDTAAGTADPQNLATQSAKVWWERRAHQDNVGEGTDYQNREFSESHLFGSSNNHVMTIHANTTYQGVHVEKGGIYANNSILAWARILPRGLDGSGLPQAVNPLVTTDTSVIGSYTAVCNEFHNFDGFTHIHRGLYQLELPAAFQNQNNYSVIVTGTNNLHLSTSYNASGEISSDFIGGLTDVEYRSRTFRKQQAELEHHQGDVRGATDVSTSNDLYPGGQHQYTVRVANSSIIQIESRVQVYYQNYHGVTTRHDDDEVFVVVVGAPDVTKFRG